MAFYQIAYTFDMEQFHADLELAVVKDGVFDVYELQRLAKQVIQNLPDEIMEVTYRAGYDEDWLDDPDGDHSQDNRWYTVNLWGVLKSSPSLSNNRSYSSHFVLEDVLPFAGWAKEDIHFLVHGTWRLDPLFRLDDNSVFRQGFRHISLHGGCLSVSAIGHLLEKLSRSEAFCLAPDKKLINSIIKVNPNSQKKPTDLLEMAYWDARDMLETAIKRNEALYLLRN